MKLALTLTLACLLVASRTFAQGFINVDFEQARVILDPSSPYYPNAILASNAVPGWTVMGSVTLPDVFYNTISLGAAAVSLQGPGSLEPILQGQFSVGLQSSDPGSQFRAAIAQIGQVPPGTESLRFFASPNSTFDVTFSGQAILVMQVGSGSGYDVWGADFSSFAGQTGELRFTSGVGPGGTGGGGFLDNIFFSSQAVPEPSTFAFFGLGMVLLCRRVVKSRR